MDWTVMVAVLALWDTVRTLAVVLFTAWYTARKVRQNGEKQGQQAAGAGAQKALDKGQKAEKGWRLLLNIEKLRVGNVVAVKWIDSSTAVSRCSETAPKDMRLVTFTLYGKVLYINVEGEKVVLAKEHSDDLAASDEMDQQVVWIPSIRGCVVLQEAEEER